MVLRGRALSALHRAGVGTRLCARFHAGCSAFFSLFGLFYTLMATRLPRRKTNRQKPKGRDDIFSSPIIYIKKEVLFLQVVSIFLLENRCGENHRHR